MFERFTDAARRTVVLAQEQARQLRHDYIGTEHLLLGLLEENNVAARVLFEMQVDPATVRQRVLEVVGEGRRPPRGYIPFTPRAKRSMEIAADESQLAGSGNVRPQHLLLGILAQAEGVGVALLEGVGVDLILLRQRLRATADRSACVDQVATATPADARLGASTETEASLSRRAPPLRIESDVPRPDVVGALLRNLPEWFGIDEAIDEYVSRSAQLPTYTALLDGAPVGVLVLQHHSDRVAELYVLAAERRLHRRGIGRALVEAAERDLARAGTTYVQVKTLGASHPSTEYAATRAFYEALGYQGLEEYPADTIWPGNPCLVMIKHLEDPA
ncbi:MAG TPA: GNAT family N-acetyltransferase [Egicoccus sp.]|nr:GNAT family N-acetyltransferase [Egicoccus sp.]HSK23591.1 GNAT family N-acetyltransferase [Egicoccus sp.]